MLIDNGNLLNCFELGNHKANLNQLVGFSYGSMAEANYKLFRVRKRGDNDDPLNFIFLSLRAVIL